MNFLPLFFAGIVCGTLVGLVIHTTWQFWRLWKERVCRLQGEECGFCVVAERRPT